MISAADGAMMNVSLNAGSGEYSASVRDTVFNRLSAVIVCYNLADWNGYDKSNSDVLDGEDFRLTFTLADGDTVEARGDNSFPTNYYKAKCAINNIFNALIDEYLEVDE